MPANPTVPMSAVSCAASRIIGNITSYSPRALFSDVPHPWLNMNRSVTPPATTSARKSPCAGAVTRPFSSKWRSHTGSPVCSRLMAVALSLDVREHSHQVDQARALREALSADVGCTAGQQALGLPRSADELRTCREERRDDAGDVRRGHRRAGLFGVGQQARRAGGPFRRVQSRPGADLAAGRGGYPFSGRYDVRLHPPVERWPLA